MMWRLWILWAAAFALASCGAHVAAPEPQVRVVEKAVPVPTPCVDDETPPAPKYAVTWDDLKVMTPGERYTKAVAGLQERDQRLREIEPIIAACR